MTRLSSSSRAGALAVTAAIATTTAVARADAPLVAPTRIEVDRADTPVGRTEFGFDGGAPVVGWGATLSGGWLEEPIVFELPDGTTSSPVRRRQTFSLGGALALGDAVVIDGRYGHSHQIGDRSKSLGDPRALDNLVPGDTRIGARIRVTGKPERAVFVRAELVIPTGDQRDYAGDAGFSLAWRLIARATVGPGIVLAGTAGLRLRGTEVLVADRLVGNEALGAVGFAIPLPPVRPLWCRDQVKLTGELAAIVGDDIGVARGPAPIEGRVGVVTQPAAGWTIGVRVARGLVDEIGAPKLRATIELTYQGAWKLLEIDRSDDQADE